MDDTENIFRINISGRTFEISSSLLLRKPDTRLGRLVCDIVNGITPTEALLPNNDESKSKRFKTVFFNRSIVAFEAILSYYQTDELHLPNNICPKAFKKEMDFWKIEINNFDTCCRYKYLEFVDTCRTRDKFEMSIRSNAKPRDVRLENSTKLQRCRAKVWSLLEHNESSVASEIIRVFFIICVAASIVTIALDTVDITKTKLDTCEIRDYLETIGYDEDVIEILHSWNCTSLEEVEKWVLSLTHTTFPDENETSFTFGDLLYERKKFTATVQKLQELSNIKKRDWTLVVIDFFLLSFFSTELLLRLCACPSLKLYFLSVLNIVDVVVLVASFIELILTELFQNLQYEDKGIRILYYLQILRVLRILRFVQNIVSIRVLSHTVTSNLKDLMVLFLYILIAVMIFANFVYFAEDKGNFPNIFEAWWWAIITMTTVGYGDIAPKSVIGKVIGSMCALTGVLVLALIIPVIANSFMNLYQFSRLYTNDILPKRAPTTIKIAPFPKDSTQKSKDTEEKHKSCIMAFEKEELKDVAET